MPEFTLLTHINSKRYCVLAPSRFNRKNDGQCPFCVESEKKETEVYRLEGKDKGLGLSVRVVNNKFPFMPIHEIIIHSPDHRKNFDELPVLQNELIFQTFRQRYNFHRKNGQVYIFHNHGNGAGESIDHPHSQLVVMPHDIGLSILFSGLTDI